MIHATAIVDSKADLDTDVEVGPYSIIKQNVLPLIHMVILLSLVMDGVI